MKPEIVIAICALIISVVSLVTSLYFSWCARDHNRRSVRPILYVAPSYYKNRISVRLWNYGTGPMVLQEVTAHNPKKKAPGHLNKLIPTPPDGFYFNFYVEIEPGRAIPAGKELTLLDASFDLKDADVFAYRDELREFLGCTVIKVKYTDIYGSKFPAAERQLTRFRNGVSRNKS